MKKLLFLVLTLLSFGVLGASATFTADNTSALDTNPERGWYFLHETNTPYWCDGTLTSQKAGTSGYISGNPIQPVTLLLYKWKPNGADSNTGFSRTSTQVKADLDCVRAAGVKVIMSIVYCSTASACDEGVDINGAIADIVTLGQIAYLYRDVIHAVRMGTIAGWGEWFASFRGLDTAANKRAIVDAYIANMPPEMLLTIRESPTLQAWFPSPINATNKFTGAYQSRIGTYTDCFLAAGDDATYKGAIQQPAGTGVQWTGTQQTQRQYAAAHNNYTMFGAEICDNYGGNYRVNCDYGTSLGDGSGLPPSNGAAGILNEGPRYHLNYLHRGFGLTQINTWISQGCYATVNRLMGYRFQYSSLVHADTMTRGTTNSFVLGMMNVGWARLTSLRQVLVRLVKAAAPDIVCKFPQQLRTLDPIATVSTTMRVMCPIPSGATVGSYAVYLEIPDVTWPGLPAPSTAQQVQNANIDSGGQVWDAANRRFATGTSVTVN
jgi:hypothetical protein